MTFDMRFKKIFIWRYCVVITEDIEVVVLWPRSSSFLCGCILLIDSQRNIHQYVWLVGGAFSFKNLGSYGECPSPNLCESKALELMKVDYWCAIVLAVWTSMEQDCWCLLLEITVETVEIKGLLRRVFSPLVHIENYSWIFDPKCLVLTVVPISYFILWDHQAINQYFIPDAVVLISHACYLWGVTPFAFFFCTSRTNMQLRRWCIQDNDVFWVVVGK